MSGRKWCEKCGELEAMANPFPWIPGGEARAHRAGCPGGRVIPIATLCSEPTTIDESDLAPGMVVVAVDDTQPLDAWVATPDAVLTTAGLVVMRDGCYLADTRLGDRHDVEGWIRRVAGSVTP